MREARIELGAVVTARVADDAVVVPDRRREGIHARGRELVRGVSLADLERAPAAGEAEEAVARGERALHRTVGARRRDAPAWRRRDVDLRLELEHRAHAAGKVAPTAQADLR